MEASNQMESQQQQAIKRTAEEASLGGLGELIEESKRQKAEVGTKVVKVKKVRVMAIRDKTVQHTHEQVAEALATKGYAVIPSAFDDKEVRQGVRDFIDRDVASFREFKEDALDRAPLGGFGVYNNPSSFHSPIVRQLRDHLYKKMAPYIDHLIGDNEDLQKEFIIDRLMVRPAGTSASPEMWHRDEAPGAIDGDTIYGGWLNLDDTQQVFSCVPGTHRSVEEGDRSGFGTIKDKELVAEYNSKRTKVSVPAGHILIFNENIIHEVVSSTKKVKSYRLFVGWRTTTSTESIIEDLDELLDKQGAVTIKSGQTPAMWAKLHWTNWIDKLEHYSTNFRPECLEEATVQSGRFKDRVVTRVHRHMKSLSDYGFHLYEPYTEEERSIYFPH
jgi:hypothetical protein